MADLLVHPAAYAEFRTALAWYEERSSRAAERFKIEFDRAIEAILANPSAFPKLDDDRRFTVLRKYPYMLVYEPCAAQVLLIAVVHERRSPTYWHDRI